LRSENERVEVSIVAVVVVYAIETAVRILILAYNMAFHQYELMTEWLAIVVFRRHDWQS